MLTLIRKLRVPASESQMALLLALNSVIMSLLLWIILWQSRVIADQRDVIQWLVRSFKLGA